MLVLVILFGFVFFLFIFFNLALFIISFRHFSTSAYFNSALFQ